MNLRVIARLRSYYSQNCPIFWTILIQEVKDQDYAQPRKDDQHNPVVAATSKASLELILQSLDPCIYHVDLFTYLKRYGAHMWSLSVSSKNLRQLVIYEAILCFALLCNSWRFASLWAFVLQFANSSWCSGSLSGSSWVFWQILCGSKNPTLLLPILFAVSYCILKGSESMLFIACKNMKK